LENPNCSTRFLRALRAAALKLGAILDLEHVLQTAVSTMVANFDSALAQIWLYDEATDALHLRASAGLSNQTAAGSPVIRDVAGNPHQVAALGRRRTPLVSNDLASDSYLDQDWIQREKLAAMAAIPLLIGGEPRGVLVHFARRALAEEAVDALAVFAAVVSASLNDDEHCTREKQIRTQAEEARQRAAFLAGASTVLAGSLDHPTTLASVARLAVPQLADWCAVYMLEPDGSIRLLAVTHVDPAKIDWAHELGRRYPPDPSAPHGVPRVLRTGQSEIYSDVPEAVLQAYARDAEHLRLLRELGLKSYMIVPLMARTRMLGALGFACAETGRRYGPEDLALAEDLARRAATAIDNALLYREAQEAINARDHFLSVASHELRTPLSPIQLQVQLLLRAVRTRTLDKIPHERLLEMLEMCDRQIKELVKLVNDLLAGFRKA
jgi:GAF domain-containing protein